MVVTLPVGAYDFRNDLIPRIRLLSSNGELLAEATGNGDPRLPVTLEYRLPDGGNRAAARPFFVEVSDSPPGSSDCTRVLVPESYELTVDVTGPSLSATAAGDRRILGIGSRFRFQRRIEPGRRHRGLSLFDTTRERQRACRFDFASTT